MAKDSRIGITGGGSGARGAGMRIGSGRVASSTRGSSKAAVRQALKTAKKSKPLAEPKSAVKVKTAAKQLPGKKDIMTVIKKRAIRNEQIAQINKSDDGYNSGKTSGAPYSQGKTKLLRQVKASNKKK